MRPIRLYTLLTITLCLGWKFDLLIAQHPVFKQFSVEDGLPSNNVYNFSQDEEGFLWLTTQNGLCRYDGRQFYNDPFYDYQGNEVTGVLIDSRNQLWVFPLDCKAAVYTNNYQKKYLISDLIGEYHCIETFQVLPNGSIILNDNYQRLHIFNQQRLQTPQTIHLPKGKKPLLLPLPNSRFALLSNSGVFEYQNNRFEQRITETPLSGDNTKMKAQLAEHLYIIADGKKLWLYNQEQQKFQQAFPKLWTAEHVINGLLIDSQDRLWLTTTNGIFVIKGLMSRQPQIDHYLEGTYMHKSFEDRSGNLWFASRRKGLFLINEANIQLLNLPNKTSVQITALHQNNEGQTWIGFDNGTIAKLDDQNKIQQKIRIPNQQQIYEIIESDSGLLTICAGQGLYQWSQATGLQQLIPGSVKCLAQSADGQQWMGRHSGVFKYPQNERICDIRTYDIVPYGKNTLLLGTVFGLYIYDLTTSQLSQFPALKDRDIRHIAITDDEQIWLATQGHGIFVLQNDSLVQVFDVQDGLVSNNCHKIIHDTTFSWIATNKGLVRIRRSDWDLKIITAPLGLPGQELSSIELSREAVIAGTDQGIAIVPKDITLAGNPAQASILSVRIKGRDTTVLDNYYLDHTNDDVVIRFTGIHLQNGKEASFRYKMSGRDPDWLESQNDMAFYSQLQPGTYNFFLQVKVPNTDWSAPVSMQFHIAPPIWNEWWFIGTMTIIILLITGATYSWIRDLRTRKNRLESKLSESQLRALRSQMNPHFIFNALNAIQGFI
ncbi:MAG: histidine kinase, partial [Saprospiraceae bacterium]|nr:histidine kinase [Saprospiraceae bacterium]